MNYVDLQKEYNKWKMKERTMKLFLELKQKRLEKVKKTLNSIMRKLRTYLN